ncbi:MAG: nicotinamide riboside transporter PnuC [Woeseia sp.]
MDGIPGIVAAQFEALSPAELIAVVAAVAYLLLAIRQSILCWFFALVSTAIYVVLFIGAKLYMESVLNGFYFIMALYGWYFWHSGGDAQSTLPVTRWRLPIHASAIVSIVGISLLCGAVLDRYTDAAFPYIDSLTTFAAIWATFLVARKVLENWWYWLVIDTVSIFLYWSRDLQLTSLLFVAYVAMIPFGLIAWTRTFDQQRAASA